ncbi:AAA family ATPase [Mycobacterium aquaticum]|uniref:HTH luxR-type domain-containing protein n=1 Tax=Mycobacterium aquaticum TaxID=1927124 RepID=A0A1X0AWJ9_9MYCO|nr:LuxR family transcriptional regulator [Mycobacterium aquaticum]ORA34447.1 hypothetical protein BST13_16995 [Mycobacterium aquaticum]
MPGTNRAGDHTGRPAYDVPGSPTEAELVTEFLDARDAGPTAILLEGEAGIGKTTMMLAAVDHARERGFRVLLAQSAAMESMLAYAALADLLADVEPAVLDTLPVPQRRAVDRIMLRTNDDGAATDPRAVSAAVLSVITRLAARSPLLVAIDDMQWLDQSSAHAIAFAARRLVGPVRVLGTARTAAGEDAVTWLQLPRPDALRRIPLQPMSIGALNIMLSRLERSFPRPMVVRIHEISGGNPFYALELARSITKDRPDALPPTLAELVRQRIDGLSHRAREALLAVACLARPTVEVVALAMDTERDELLRRLSEAEHRGIITLDGNRFHFTHPLLAHGVHSSAAPHARREMHRRLAALVEQPELRARHLAQAATTGDDATLRALDEAAEAARLRGAPAAAAEFLELAIALGGDTAARRIDSAVLHFNAGDGERARQALAAVITPSGPTDVRARAMCLLGVWTLLDGSTRQAADMLRRALDLVGDDRTLRVEVLVPLSFAELNLGHVDLAAHHADHALADTAELGNASLRSTALCMAVLVSFLSGRGVDEAAMGRALELADGDQTVSALMNPNVLRAQLFAGTGRLEQSDEELSTIRRHYLDRGEDGRLTFVAFLQGLNAIWQGQFAKAAQVADEATQRAHELDRDIPHAVAWTLRAAVAAYTGREQDARRGAEEALALALRCESNLVAVWSHTTLGFLQVSQGDHQSAVATLEPLISVVRAMPEATEILVTPFLPDAAEALIQVGRYEDAEPLVDALERNGRRLDRPWMLACGARCRAMLSAGRGDLDGAEQAATLALAEHERLPMPFERARTQLLLGQLYRRRRHRETAAATLQQALTVFESLGTPLWAEQARRAADRIHRRPAADETLTDAERRIAELAASGLTNREVGAALFISAKTVEAHLSRIYRKLGIRSRSELGWHIQRPDA